MNTSKSYMWPVVAVIVAVFLVLVALPDSAKQWAPAFLRAPSLHFGLDLAGGTQLDFRISERELDEQLAATKAELATAQGEEATRLTAQVTALETQKANLVEAIRAVIERRINALGVSEARITPSEYGDEKHLLVECPGVVDVQECIDTVGKTIQLEFKEEFNAPTEEYEAQITALADESFARITSGVTLDTVAQDLTNEIAVFYIDQAEVFQDQLPEALIPLWEAPLNSPVKFDGEVTQPIQQADGTFDVQSIPGIYIAEALTEKTSTGRVITDEFAAMEYIAENSPELTYEVLDAKPLDANSAIDSVITMDNQGQFIDVAGATEAPALVFNRSFTSGQETMTARQILVAFSGSFQTGDAVTRSEAEALELATDLRQQLQNGADFAALAQEYSDGPAAENGGFQESFSRDQKDEAYAEAAFGLASGEVSDVITTPFGYYIIKAETAAQEQPDTATFAVLRGATPEAATAVAEAKTRLEAGLVTRPEDQIAIRYLFFSKMPSGWKDTELDGKHFRSAAVALDEFSRPVVQINFDDEGASLFQQLTRENIGKRIAIFVGGQLVSAPTVNAEISGGTAIITGSSNLLEAQELAQDLNTGAIPAPIYLSGQRTVEPTLGANALQTSLQAALIGVLVLMVFMVLVYRLLGLMANIALGAYALIFYAMLKLPLFLVSDQYIVLTLAGMAGIILSIGMAVDANVLIFERTKEELRKGKLLKTAAETGFTRAWPSIRDGNFSTFITCAILFIIGTSIVRGFAITLGVGVAISMFSAIIITQFLVRQLAKSPLSTRPELFGVRTK